MVIEIPKTLERVIADLQLDVKNVVQEPIKDNGSLYAMLSILKFEDWGGSDRLLRIAYGKDLLTSTPKRDRPFTLSLASEVICKIYGIYKGPLLSVDDQIFFFCQGSVSDKNRNTILVMTTPCFVVIDCAGKLTFEK